MTTNYQPSVAVLEQLFPMMRSVLMRNRLSDDHQISYLIILSYMITIYFILYDILTYKSYLV